jgi:hypothetical protein
MDLATFWRKLQEYSSKSAPDPKKFRPFVCPGDPRDCRAFVVGFNPASDVEAFKNFWSCETGFDKRKWEDAYQAARIAVRKKPISPTRERLNRIARGADKIKILETNLYATATSATADLDLALQNSALFQFLVEEIEPKAILFHSVTVKRTVEKIYGINLPTAFESRMLRKVKCMVAVVNGPLYLIKYEDAQALGKSLQAACSKD